MPWIDRKSQSRSDTTVTSILKKSLIVKWFKMSSSRSTETASSKPNDQKPSHKDIDEGSFNPRSPKFITVMLGMYMSVFLVALVGSSPKPILHTRLT